MAVLLAAVAVSADGDHRAIAAGRAGLAIVALAGGVLFASAVAVGAAAALLGVVCIAADAPPAPLAAFALFVIVETALWSADDRTRVTEERGPRRDRLVFLCVIGSASIAVGGLLRLLSRDVDGESTIRSVVAGLSVTALAALITAAVRRHVR